MKERALKQGLAGTRHVRDVREGRKKNVNERGKGAGDAKV